MTCNLMVAVRLLTQDNFLGKSNMKDKKHVDVEALSPSNVDSETHHIKGPARFHFNQGDGLKYVELSNFGVGKA